MQPTYEFDEDRAIPLESDKTNKLTKPLLPL